MLAALDLKPLQQLVHAQVQHPIQPFEEGVQIPPALMASRGRLMVVKLRLPRPLQISRSGSYTLPMTRVRQPM